MALLLQGQEDLLKGDALHVQAESLFGSGIKAFGRVFFVQPVDYPGLGCDNELLRLHVVRVETHDLGGNDLVGELSHLGAAFGVRQDHGVRVQPLLPENIIGGASGMGRAEVLPSDDFTDRCVCPAPREMLGQHG